MSVPAPPPDAYRPCAEFIGERLRRRGFAVEYVRAEGTPGAGWTVDPFAGVIRGGKLFGLDGVKGEIRARRGRTIRSTSIASASSRIASPTDRVSWIWPISPTSTW